MKWFFFFFLSAGIYLLHFLFTGYGIWGDGNGYYAYTHTLYFQRNLDFGPIYEYLSSFQGKKYIFSRVFWDIRPTVTGLLPNPWTIGTAILWLPGIYVIDVLVKLFKISVNQFSCIYELGPGLTGIVLGIGGLYFLEKFLTESFKKRTAVLAVLILFFTTNLFYYLSFEPALSHSVIFFLISFFLFRWQATSKNRQALQWLELGFLLGLITITRLAESVISLLLISDLLCGFRKENLRLIKKSGLVFVGFLGGIFPQLLAQLLIYGSFIYQPYLSGENGYFIFNISFPFQLLFSVRRGLFTWTPTIFLAIIGLLIKLKRTEIKSRSYLFLLVFIFHWLIISFWSGALSAGYGNRLFIGTFPLLAYGLANFLEVMNLKSIKTFILVGVLWNVLLLSQFFFDKERLVDGVDLTPENFFKGQVETPIRILQVVKTKGWRKTIREDFME